MNTILQTLQRELAASITGLDADQTQLQLIHHLDKWSIQQIIQHLLLTYRSTAQVIRTRIDKNSPTKATPGINQRLRQLVLIRCGYFPTGVPAPALVTPASDLSPATGRELSEALASELQQLDLLCTQASTLFGESRFASHVNLGPLTVGQWRKFHLVHGRHHARQIRAIRRAHGL